MQTDLNATSAQFSLSISLFILVQGLAPLVWSAVSEIKGRKVGDTFILGGSGTKPDFLKIACIHYFSLSIYSGFYRRCRQQYYGIVSPRTFI